MWRPWHGWLPAVLPASAQTFRTSDPDMAATLAESGATQAAAPDVELATSARAVVGDAPCAIVFLREDPSEGAGLAARATARLGGTARVMAGVAAARRRLDRLGCDDIRVLPFDQARRPQLAGPRAADIRALPLGAVVAGRRAPAEPTVLEAAAAAAGEPMAAARVGLSGTVIAVGERRVLRVILRAGEAQVRDGASLLARLRAAGPPPVVGERIAWPVGSGELALAHWSLEPRLPGAPAATVEGPLLEDCVEVLAALFAIDVDEPAARLADAGRLVARACPPELATRVAALGERLDEQLADVPRGVAHGDFWADNLLARDGRLTGVVDWSGAGGGRLPALDLLHLLASGEASARDRALGDAVVGYLLPLAARGGGPVIAGYCRGVGLAPEPAVLTALVTAYWLDHVAHHLRSYADRAERPAWLGPNVHAVARAVG